MRRWPFWIGIGGGFAVVFNLFTGIGALINPTNLPLLNVAILTTDALSVAFGVFLIVIALREKQKEDSLQDVAKPAPNSPADIERLAQIRNWILGFVFLWEIVDSAQVWILNNYSAGLTPINVGVIFDLIFNILFVYLIVGLFRNQKNILGILFYVITFYTIGFVAVSIWRGEAAEVIGALLFGAYFICAVKLPLNRMNHRITHFVILPIMIVLPIVLAVVFQYGHILSLTKDASLLAQQFTNDTTNVMAAYGIVTSRDIPLATDMEQLRNVIGQRDTKIQEILSNINSLENAYKKQPPTISQQKLLEQARLTREFITLNKAQSDKMLELAAYLEKINFFWYSDEEKTKVLSLRSEIDAYNDQITEALFKLSNSNVN